MSTSSVFISSAARMLVGAAAVGTALGAPNAVANASSGGGCGETKNGITVCIADNGDNRIHAWTLIWPERADKATTRIEICRVEDPNCVDIAAGPVQGTERGAEIFAVPVSGAGEFFAVYYHGDEGPVTSPSLTWR